MTDESSIDPFLEQLCEGYSETEVAEIKKYINEWDAATYISASHNILDHALRKEFEPLKYLRKAHNFNKREPLEFPKLVFVKMVLLLTVRVVNF